MLLSAMAYWHPLPDLNGTVARHMLRLFATSRDYPVLGYLPVSLTRTEVGARDVSRAGHGALLAASSAGPVIEGEIDGTPDILTYLQLVVASLRRSARLHRDRRTAEDGRSQRGARQRQPS